MVKSDKQKNNTMPVKRYYLTLMSGWTLMVLIAFFLHARGETQKSKQIAITEAQVSFEKDIVLREFFSILGGAYAPVGDMIQPNPYIANVPERDIVTPSGKQLTMITPAHITRKVFELQKTKDGVISHLSSLNPLNPENAADAWETRALKRMEAGQIDEMAEFITVDNLQMLRYMRPMYVEKPCLKCHEIQNYKEGEIRGGISVMIPMKRINSILRDRIVQEATKYTILLVIGLLGIYFGGMRVLKSEKDLARLNEEVSNLMMHDELTGLYNRRGFATLSANLIKLAERLEKRLLFYFIDLDGMKRINDDYGHLIGDDALKNTTLILQKTFRASDVIARMGGDEFVVAMMEDTEHTTKIVNERLIKNVHAFNSEASRTYKISFSTGITYYNPENPKSIEELIQEADRLMYEEKKIKRAKK